MAAQNNSTSALGRYWDYLFIDLAGLCVAYEKTIKVDIESEFLISIRS